MKRRERHWSDEEQGAVEGWGREEGLRVRRRKRGRLGGRDGEWRDEEGEVRRRRNGDWRREEEEVEEKRSGLEEAEGVRRRKTGGTRGRKESGVLRRRRRREGGWAR